MTHSCPTRRASDLRIANVAARGGRRRYRAASSRASRDGATMPYTTSRRMFLLSTPRGEDALLIQQFEGREGISRLFEFRLLMLSEDDSVAAGDRKSTRLNSSH